MSTHELPEAWVRRVAIRIAVREVQPGRARAVADAAHDRRALLLEDRPVAEIADLLEVSEATVKQHLHRARPRLARLLSEEVSNGAG